MQYFISRDSLAFYNEHGLMQTVSSDHINFAKIRDMLLEGSDDALKMTDLANVEFALNTRIAQAVAGKYLKEGTVVISNGTVLYDGIEVDTSLTRRLLRALAEHDDINPWIKFMESLYLNPNHATRFELYDWMRACDLPITTDGCFLAFKRVRDDYKDCHSGKFDNSVGQVVQLEDRTKVDPNRNNHCSRGLHFCSAGYLPAFHGDRVVVLKIAPADVVSIPTDYNFTKGRCWLYHVMGEITLEAALNKTWPAVVEWNTPVAKVISY